MGTSENGGVLRDAEVAPASQTGNAGAQLRRGAVGDWTITHDFMYALGGAERVTATLARETLPGAHLLAIGYDDAVARELGVASQIGSLGGRARRLVNQKTYRALTPVYPHILSRVSVPGNVLASSYAFAHLVRATGRMVVYCHSPLRQAWSGADEYAASYHTCTRSLYSALAGSLRRHDVNGAHRADAYISSGPVVSKRIQDYYGIAPVAEIPPPVDTAVFKPSEAREDYFVWAGRIVEPYKRLGLVIDAFRDLNERLVVVGDGRDKARLQSRSTPNVTFTGAMTAESLARTIGQSRGLIFPSQDDFGMIAVESMACGTPVLAFAGGGSLATILPNETGSFFSSLDARDLAKEIRAFASRSWSTQRIRAHALTFSSDTFSRRTREVLDSL